MPGAFLAGEVLATRPNRWRRGLPKKGLAIRISVPETVPENVLGDPARLRQILLNLISNAIKFTENRRSVSRSSGRIGSRRIAEPAVFGCRYGCRDPG